MTDDKTKLPPETPKLIEAADGLHIRQEIDNIAWADMGGWAVVIDALEHRSKKDEVFEAIGRTLGDVPVRYVLNTHTHHDHVALNKAFEKEYSAEVVNMRTADIPPDGKRLAGETRNLLMLAMNGCHTDDDCVVWFPDDRVLFTGDLFGWGLLPVTGRLRQTTLQRLTDYYAKMIELDPAVVVPGHGPLCSADQLRRFTRYVEWLVSSVNGALKKGKSKDRILQKLSVPRDMRHWWRLADWKHHNNIEMVISAMRGGNL